MAGVRQTASGVVQTSGGVAQTVVETGPTVIDDFEDGDITGWVGDTADFSASNETTLEGSWLLYSSADSTQLRYDTAGTTTRGNTYRMRWQTDGQDDRCWFFVGTSPGTSVTADGYGLVTRTTDDTWDLYRWDSGSSTHLAGGTVTLNTATEYWSEIEYAPTGSSLVARVYDASGTELASGSAVDDNYTGGTVGVRNDFGAGGKFDYFTER